MTMEYQFQHKKQCKHCTAVHSDTYSHHNVGSCTGTITELFAVTNYWHASSLGPTMILPSLMWLPKQKISPRWGAADLRSSKSKEAHPPRQGKYRRGRDFASFLTNPPRLVFVSTRLCQALILSPAVHETRISFPPAQHVTWLLKKTKNRHDGNQKV